ncbi:hypothetical protein Brms1b_012154 [Colletotrichum noveboracense]|nr:hypothetical protein COL940_012436 [Colletotrichum noveboracense]KAJ0274487.1 hypothetical protein CBS470a_011754 [Colletotrichum nupharicola]KAJ0302106.1 hypothetical protein Brms1b_012154 [Colletotrichum noveboracense]
MHGVTLAPKISGKHNPDGQNEAHVENLQTALPGLNEKDALAVAQAGGWEVDALIDSLERELEAAGGVKKGIFDLEFTNTKYFTWLIVAFASMGGLLSGLDQSLISGANLFLPGDLGLTDRQNSLVNSAMPLGAVGGALILSPSNEYLGRRMSIIISCVLYTIGAALCAGAMNFGMIVSARVILGMGVGLEGGTVPVYVAETAERRIRGNVVSLYQLNIALGEVLGYAVAAMFLHVKGNWRFILGSSLLFSSIMWAESPRFLMHKGKTLEAYKVWKRIRGTSTPEAREEFFIMKVSVLDEQRVVSEGAKNKRFPWMDFFTVPRARRALIYANIMILLGQLTGVNAIMYYMSILMQQIGFNDEKATYMSLVGGGSLLIGTIPAVMYMEKFGRRFWANTMLPGFFVGLVIIGASYQIPTTTNTTGAVACYLVGLALYMMFFEVYPTYLRSYGMTTSSGLLFLSSFIVTYNFTAMQEAMTRTGLTLGFYGGIAIIGWFYQMVFMPETKDKTLEEIDVLFEKPTSEIVAMNMKSIARGMSKICGGGKKESNSPGREMEVDEKNEKEISA